MTTLTPELKQALERGDIPRLKDPESNAEYVLIRAELYERIRTLFAEDFELRDTYPAQMAAAMRAGWDDPKMDDYANYDENFAKRCR